MADAFTPNFNMTLPEVGASFDTWGTKLNADLSVVDKHLVPVGGIIMWSGSVANIPNNWALCDGTNGTPDLRDRFIVGAGGGYSPGATGGSASVVLATDHIPAHNHSASTAADGGHSHTASTGSAGSHNHSGSANTAGYHGHSGTANSAGNHRHSFTYYGSRYNTSSGSQTDESAKNRSGVTGYTSYDGAHTHSLSINGNGNHTHSLSINSNGAHTHSVSVGTVAAHTHGVTVDNTGGGQAHENRPPYYALAYIMNIG